MHAIYTPLFVTKKKIAERQVLAGHIKPRLQPHLYAPEQQNSAENCIQHNKWAYKNKKSARFIRPDTKNGIKNVLNHPSKIFSAGVYTLFSECLLLSIPLIGTKYAAPLLGFYHIGILMPFIAMIKIGIRLYEDGRAQDNQNNNLKKQKAL